MNASPTLPVSQTASTSRGASAERASGSDAFAGFFERFNAGAGPNQAEPTALPEQAAAADELVEDLDLAPQPDTQLLAALGLMPLPSETPAAMAPGLLGGLSGAFAGADAALPGAPDGSARSTATSGRLAAAESAASNQAMPAPTLLPEPSADSATGPQGTAAAANLALASLLTGQPSASAETAAAAAPLIALAQGASQNGKPAATPLPAMPALPGGPLPTDAAIVLDALPATVVAAEPALTAATPRAAADFRSNPFGAPPAISTPAAEAGASDEGMAIAAALNARTAEGERGGGSRTALTGTAATLAAERADFGHSLRDALSPSTLAPLPPSTRLDPTTPQFSGLLSQQMAWLANQKIGRAEIRLDPEELGPLEVSIELDGDEIRAEFSSRSLEVRSLLESQVPKLRELLAEQGFSLADAQVGQERAAYSEAQSQRQNFKGDGSAKALGSTADSGSGPVATTRARLGLIDDYA